MIVESNGYKIDSLTVVTADHLLTAMAQVDLLGQEDLSWLHDWCERQIALNRDDAKRLAVFAAFNELICSLIDTGEPT